MSLKSYFKKKILPHLDCGATECGSKRIPPFSPWYCTVFQDTCKIHQQNEFHSNVSSFHFYGETPTDILCKISALMDRRGPANPQKSKISLDNADSEAVRRLSSPCGAYYGSICCLELASCKNYRNLYQVSLEDFLSDRTLLD